MIRVVFGKSFLKSAKILPEIQTVKLAHFLELLKTNPYDPQLHTKRLSGPLAGVLSFRITRDWRALFVFDDERTIRLLRVANRKDIYR